MSNESYKEAPIQKRISDLDLKNEKEIQKIREKIDNYLDERSFFELWCDKYNHSLAFFRTIFSALNLVAACLVAIKVFGVI